MTTYVVKCLKCDAKEEFQLSQAEFEQLAKVVCPECGSPTRQVYFPTPWHYAKPGASGANG